MRLTIIAATGTALALGLAAPAFAQSAQPQAEAPAGQSAAPKVRSVNVVDVSELPAETKAKVDEIAGKASPEDLKGLRTSIDKSPEIKKALAAKGADSSHVIVANLDQQGTLTLVTKKRA